MGFSGISIPAILIILVLFGPKRLKNLGSEMGNFLKSFRKAIDDKEQDQNEADK